jgi:hypothetical protein
MREVVPKSCTSSTKFPIAGSILVMEATSTTRSFGTCPISRSTSPSVRAAFRRAGNVRSSSPSRLTAKFDDTTK